MFVNQDVFAAARSENALLGFFFAQRTGSPALVRWISETIPPDKVYVHHNVPNFVHWKKTPSEDLKNSLAYAGFSEFVPRDLGGRPFAAFSLVRHPVYRIASLYEVSKRDKSLVYHRVAAASSFEDFYRHVAADRPYYFSNLCCYRIANQDSFAAAQEAMSKHYAAVGLADQTAAMTRGIADNIGWSIEPLTDQTSDVVKYAQYLESPALDEILSNNKEDLRLFEYVQSAGSDQGAVASVPAPAPASESVPITALSTVKPCPGCGNVIDTVDKDDKCPHCGTPPRIRSLVDLAERVVGPHLAAAGMKDRPLLAIGAGELELRILSPYFEKFQSASLYGKYGADHMSGVDVRSMQGVFADNSFSGAFGILLFDYFPEHEQALAELYRVIAPGGILFTLVLATRVMSGAEPPELLRDIRPRPGYFDYVPKGGVLRNVKVGQDWLLGAIARSGFEAQQVRIYDELSGQPQEWFLGFKPRPEGAARLKSVAQPTPAEVKKAAKPAPVEETKDYSLIVPSRVSRTPASGGLTEGFEQEFQIAVDPAFGFKGVNVKLSIPSVPTAGRTVSFSEHKGQTVVAVMEGGVLVSEDLGRSWNLTQFAGEEKTDFVHCFTTKSGDRLLQVKSPEDATVRAPDMSGAVYRYDKAWNLKSRMASSDLHHWHGSCSIDQSGDTIIWAEYPDNKGKYRPGGEATAVNSRVFRSRDGGTTWEVVFSKTWEEIRHFHVVAADPHVPGQWWLSSGDRPSESYVWVSRDDGTTWTDVTDPDPKVLLYPAFQKSAQALHRFTDMWIGQDEIIWGADDWLGHPSYINDPNVDPGRRAGARMFRTPRTSPLAPRDAGWVGNPVRSVTDLGPALLITTEGKRDVLKRPQVFLMSKTGEGLLKELFTIQVEGGGPTGFTYSRASRVAVDGVMFSFRGGRDLAALPTRILRWDIKFD